MKEKGTITVFLSLILVLLFSFLMTALEAARIQGAAAYVSMVSRLSGDSFLAGYYYPLFQEYRLFGVDAGTKLGYLSEKKITETLEERVNFGLENCIGGLLRFPSNEVTLEEYKTLMTEEGKEFLAQIRKQTVLDGTSIAIEALFEEKVFAEAGTVGKVYRKQEEALAATAKVTKELLKLMELTDGIRMGEQGLDLDRNGRLQAEGSFIKQLVPMTLTELEAAYENEEVFHTISDKFYRAEEAAVRIRELVQQIMDLEWEIEALKDVEDGDKQYLAMLRREKRSLTADAREEYRALQKKINAVENLLKNALRVLDVLETKQKEARVAVKAYELFLKGTQSVLSEEVYQVFFKELDTMKAYAGMEGKGIPVQGIRQSFTTDLHLLEGFSLDGFSEGNLSRVEREMETVELGMQQYTVEDLWFTYGEIVLAEKTGKNVLGALGELLTTGILSLVGITKEEKSNRSLDGKNLPSDVLEKENLLEELLFCMEKVEELFYENDIGTILKQAGNAVLDSTALELYCMKYFHCFGEEAPYTKLNYEREYLVFGQKKDATNLLYMVLHLVAVRTMFSMVSLLKQPEKTAQLEALATGVVGFTGIPVLAAVVKYSLLLLWSVEEALVEVAALLQGKRIALIGRGMISFDEMFRIQKEMIVQKAKNMPSGIGAAYSDYLVLFSLTRTTKERMYRTMDLIQENIRYRYRDSFRIRNVVTEVSFCTKTELKKLYDTGLFPETAYKSEWKEKSAY